MPFGQLLNLSEHQVLISETEQGLQTCRVVVAVATVLIEYPARCLALSRCLARVHPLVPQSPPPGLTRGNLVPDAQSGLGVRGGDGA